MIDIENCYIDIKTGEITKKKPVQKKKEPEHKVTKYVGVDTKYPCDCLDKEELISSLKQIDPFLKNELFVNHRYLLQSVIKGYLTAKTSEAVFWFAEKIVGWNYGFTSKEEIVRMGFTSKSNFSKWCKSIEGYVKLEQVSSGLDVIRFKVHPYIAWKGDFRVKEGSVEKALRSGL